MGWNSLAVLAQLVIIEGPDDGLFVYDGTPAKGNLIASVASAAGTDDLGNPYVKGFGTYASATGAVSQLEGGALKVGDTADAAPAELIASGGVLSLLSGASAAPGEQASEVSLLSRAASGLTSGALELFCALVLPNWSVLAPSGDATGATDFAAISQQSGNGFSIFLLPGNWHVNQAISPSTGMSIIGGGGGSTVIHQVNSAVPGIEASDVASITLRGFDLIGPSSGSQHGIVLTKVSANNIPFTDIADVRISHFGGDGLNITTPIVSTFRNVNSFLNGGNGFTLSDPSACTSCTFTGCYANANGGYGYSFTNLQYSSLNGCACDNNLNGYLLSGCHGVNLNGCGAEGTTTDSIIITGSKACGVYGGVIFTNAHYGIHVTGSSQRITIAGVEEISPAGGAANFLITDSGTTGVAWGIVHLTADSIGGTWTNVDGSA